MADSFPEWIARVRKDPLGSTGYNKLRDRFRWVETMFAQEHLLAATGASSGTAGEHNAAEIPREVGGIHITAGPTAGADSFRYAPGAARTALGTVQLTLDPSPYPTINQMSLQLQNCSENGINAPCTTSALILSTSLIEFYSKKMTGALATPANNTWAAEDANFHVAIHGPALPPGSPATIGTSKVKGNWLTQDALDWNAMAQSDADLRSKFLADGINLTHSAAGDHTTREVARTYVSAQLQAGGGAYRIQSTSARNPCTSITYVGLGIAQCHFANTWSLPAQVFVIPGYATLNGGLSTDVFSQSTPRSLIGTNNLYIYFYQYDFTNLEWNRADTDFFLVLHA